MKLLFIGDVSGPPGRMIVQSELPRLIDEEGIDFTIANGENSAGGFGMHCRAFHELHDAGMDAFTMGNHTWDKKDIHTLLKEQDCIVRPANYNTEQPGLGWRMFGVGDKQLAVINLLGTVNMDPVADNPFKAADAIIKQLDTPYILVDFHAETTSEKIALGWYLDGRVSAVVGTHTHVQTNDARILPRGTGYLTDAGMTGPRDSVLGVDKNIIIDRFVNGSKQRFELAYGDRQFNGVIIDLDERGRCRDIRTVNFWQPAL